MKVLVTGAGGFIGRNLSVRLGEEGIEVLGFTRGQSEDRLRELVQDADAVAHLAGENRPPSPEAFEQVNVGLTRSLCEAVRASRKPIPLLFASSIQALLANPYGESKLRAEGEVQTLSEDNGNPVAIYRLPGVFGKWCRPNYNSVVATFCYNIARDLPIVVNDPEKVLRLVYIDDVVTEFVGWLKSPGTGVALRGVSPEYSISLGDLASRIRGFSEEREALRVGDVGVGLTRALYATFVSYLPTEKFSYPVPAYRDPRGVFVEMLKTRDSGQFSFFTAGPGVTRGGHYHHTKTEKFLVLKGRARFGFRNIVTNETFHLETSGEVPRVVDTIPGWAHDITNVGNDDLIVMLWANEVFDRQRPDTISDKV